jgi:hypothetical protein
VPARPEYDAFRLVPPTHALACSMSSTAEGERVSFLVPHGHASIHTESTVSVLYAKHAQPAGSCSLKVAPPGKVGPWRTLECGAAASSSIMNLRHNVPYVLSEYLESVRK